MADKKKIAAKRHNFFNIRGIKHLSTIENRNKFL